MFSKKPEPQKPSPIGNNTPNKPASSPAAPSNPMGATPASLKAKPPASTLSTDIHIKGNVKTSGDIQISGTVDGDIRAHLLTVGEGSTVKGEIVADDIVVHGRVIGRVRGLKVRLTATARVEGDIIHKTIAIESGAHFEGSVTRQDDPLNASSAKVKSPIKSPE